MAVSESTKRYRVSGGVLGRQENPLMSGSVICVPYCHSFIKCVPRNDTRIPEDSACPSCETWFWLLDTSDENVASGFVYVPSGPAVYVPRTGTYSVFAMIIEQISG